MSPTKLIHTKDGRTLCNSHATRGAPGYHTEGCEACAEARAKGIVRPDITSVPAKRRGRALFKQRRVDWEKIPAANKAGLASCIQRGPRW